MRMKAWRIEQYGASPSLTTVERPQPGPGEALIRIRAAGLNFADLLMAQGRYQDRIPAPFTPGLELAGTVEALGPDTDGPPPGSRIAANLRSGAFAEYALAPVNALLPLPADMPFETAAGFQIAYGTSHLALTHAAHLLPGETLFVTGAAGGVGLTAVEIGRHLGARVIASARGPVKAALARAAGAGEVLDSNIPDLKERLRELGGINVTYDTVGGPGFDAAMRATHPGGRMLAIGFAGGDVPQVPLNQLLVRNISVIGLWWGGYHGFAPEALNRSLAELLNWWESGRLRPHITALPFTGLTYGLELLRSRLANGKLVITLPD